MSYIYDCERWFYKRSLLILGEALTKFLARHWSFISRISIALIYIGVGISYYKQIEGWSGTNSLYFITVSITTVGYGDYHPSYPYSRTFTAFYILFGIVFIMTNASVLVKSSLVGLQSNVIEYFPSSTTYSKAIKKVILSIIMIVTLVIIGTIFYTVNESWTAAMAFYWTIQTMTTVGYGDLHIKYESTRQFSIVFIFVCVLVFATAVANINDSYDERKHEDMRSIAKARHEVLSAFSDKDIDDTSDELSLKNDPSYILESLIQSRVLDRDRDINKLYDLYDKKREKKGFKNVRRSVQLTSEVDQEGWKIGNSRSDDDDQDNAFASILTMTSTINQIYMLHDNQVYK